MPCAGRVAAGILTALALGCAQDLPFRATDPPALRPEPARAQSAASQRWSALAREGREALRAGRPEWAEMAFTAALATWEPTPAGTARTRATLGNLTRLASIYRRLGRNSDAERVMEIVDAYVRSDVRRKLDSDDYAARYRDWSEQPLEHAYRGPDPFAQSEYAFEPGLEALIRRTARRYRVDPHLVKAVVAAESNFDTLAVSEAGAQGLMQLMPQTAREMGVRSPFRPSENIQGGVRYLKALLERYTDLAHALAAYNAGPLAVDRFGGIPPYPETEQYVKRVLRYYREYRSTDTP